MAHFEKRLSSETKFEGRVITVTLDRVELENGGSRKALAPGEAPEAVFHTAGVKPVAVYAYCNLHGLWKTEL